MVLLIQIACLSAKKSFYHTNEKVMQTITWDLGLSSFSQHTAFHACVKAIHEQATQFQVFYLGSTGSDQIAALRPRIYSIKFLS